MAQKPMWFVRAGEKAKYAADFRKDGFVAVGWSKVGPLSEDFTDEALDKAIAETFPDESEGTRSVWAAQLRRFMREVRVGDAVVTYDLNERGYLIGTIDSEVEWHEHPLPRWRRVTWSSRVDRDSLTESTRNKLGSIATLFRVGPEPEAELLQNAQPLFGDLSAVGPVRGQRPRGLTSDDFDVLRRNPTSVPWPSLPDNDRTAIKSLRQALLSYAVKLAADLKTSVTLKPFASHPNPSGRNAQHYWSCVYPETAPNKSFSFQVSVIVRARNMEIGFGAGSGTAEVGDPATLNALKDQFRAQRERLQLLRDQPWLSELVAQARSKGFRLRTRWLRDNSQDELPDVAAWVDHAASDEGGGAAISLFVEPTDAVARANELGDWLVEQLSVFAPLLDAIYAGIAPPTPHPKPPLPRPALSREWLAEQTLWTAQELEPILDTLGGQAPQAILAGPPGTGKTWVAELLARYLTQDRPGQFRLVQFHPSYSYEEFIEGLRPVSTGGAISFEVKKGTVLQMAVGLEVSAGPRVLVIDEMNRANVPRVFGELLYLLEYRDRAIDLQYSSGFKLPPGLTFIGTMNTADRSIRSIDVALRRRFDLFELPPSPEILERYYTSKSNEVAGLVDGFRQLNAALTESLDRHHTIGHAFFMADPMTPAKLARVWKYKIEPLIEEYFFDQPDIAAEFRLGRFWPEAANAR